MIFDGTEKIIGHGAQAEVYLWKGSAYKVFRPDYPAEWIAFEIDQQKAVNALGLCPVRYEKTEDAHTIKMDFVDGIMLEERLNGGYKDGFADLAAAHRFVHSVEAAGTIPNLRESFTSAINSFSLPGITDAQKQRALEIINEIPEEKRICHLDLHLQNLMFLKDSKDAFPYVIIDWVNAREGNPIFDYARVFVIFKEFAPFIIDFFMDAIKDDLNKLQSKDAFHDAVGVCALLRLTEHNSDAVRQIVKEYLG